MNRILTINFVFILCFISLITIPNRASGCQVPVFRYALEQWQPDIYEIFVFYSGSLSPADKENIEWLENNSVKNVIYSNYKITTLNIDSGIPNELQELWQNVNSQQLPHLVMMYPGGAGIRQIVWHGRLTTNDAKALVISPVRQKVAEKILDGEAIVWIMLEGSNQIENDAVAATLQTSLKNIENKVLTSEKDLTGSSQLGNDQEIVKNVPIKLSMIRLSRKELSEHMLINMLTQSEPDLNEYSSNPIVFPVYGRGRILYALIGKGINQQNIYNACSFLTGSCSCEVKAANPGVDLLMSVNWESGIHEWLTDTTPFSAGRQEFAGGGTTESGNHDASLVYVENKSSVLGIKNATISGDQRTNPFQKNDVNFSPKNINGQSFQVPAASGKTANNLHSLKIAAPSSPMIRNAMITLICLALTVAVVSLKIVFRKTEDKK